MIKKEVENRIGKKAQFYIVAAVIIIAVLIGFVAVRNVARTGGDTRIFDLEEELRIETGYVYDYGLANSEEIGGLAEEWAEAYKDYTKGQDAVEDWIFIYGDEGGMTALTFTTVSEGSVGISSAAGDLTIEITKVEKKKKSLGEQTGNLEVKFKDYTYPFKLNKGQNFFFIIRKQGE